MSVPSLLFTHWQPSASVVAPAAASVALYLTGVRRRRGRWQLRPTLSFLAGVACVVIALQSGIATDDEQLLSAHMTQHMLLLLVAPALLLGGRPLVLGLSALSPRARAGPARALGRVRALTAPAPALALVIAVVMVTHLASFYDATLRHPALHYAEHALYLIAGLLLLSPLLDGDPAPRRRLGGLGMLLYVMVSMVPMALLGAYLNRHATVVYGPYATAAHTLGLSALVDQAQAGAIMWVGGNTVMVAIGLWAAVGAMVAEERRQTARERRATPGSSVDAPPAPLHGVRP